MFSGWGMVDKGATHLGVFLSKDGDGFSDNPLVKISGGVPAGLDDLIQMQPPLQQPIREYAGAAAI